MTQAHQPSSLTEVTRAVRWLMVVALVALTLSVTAGPDNQTPPAAPDADVQGLFSGQAVAVTSTTNILMRSTCHTTTGCQEITGESTVRGYQNQVRLRSAKLGGNRPVNFESGGGTPIAGAFRFDALVVTHTYDAASPKLFEASVLAKTIGTTKVVFLQQTADQVRDVLTIELGNAYVAGLAQNHAAGSKELIETVTLAYQSIKVTYHQYRADGTVATLTACWNVESARADCPAGS